ncbi:MAG: class I SAM-dependent methyltransferase [Bacteroidota bacterium]|nr:class I SAM-dependent methyltransferase [Bacteroidota bacterium]
MKKKIVKGLDNRTIMRFLEEKHFATGFFDSLKIKYRSLICPYISLIQKVNNGEKVGDVGCGSGQLLLLLSEFARPSYVFGIEIKDRLIKNAKLLFSRSGRHYRFEIYDGEHFPNELAEMDTIFLVDVLHHLPRKKQAGFLKNLSEKIKPGGRLILKDINGASPFVVFNKLHDLIFAREIGNEISINKASTLLQQNGFDIIEQEKRLMYVYPHYTLVAKKR